MTPFLFAHRVMPSVSVALVALATLSMPVADVERWIPLPDQPNSYTSLDVGSIQRMPNSPVSAQVRVETSSRADIRSLQCIFGASRDDVAGFLYTVDCRSRQFSVSQAKLYQNALTVSERQIASDAGWQRMDSVGLTDEVVYQLCGR